MKWKTESLATLRSVMAIRRTTPSGARRSSNTKHSLVMLRAWLLAIAGSILSKTNATPKRSVSNTSPYPCAASFLQPGASIRNSAGFAMLITFVLVSKPYRHAQTPIRLAACSLQRRARLCPLRGPRRRHQQSGIDRSCSTKKRQRRKAVECQEKKRHSHSAPLRSKNIDRATREQLLAKINALAERAVFGTPSETFHLRKSRLPLPSRRS